MILKVISVGPMQANCYILAAASNTSAIIIDPGYEARKIKRALDKNKLTPAFIINTHGHIDHIGCDDEFGVPVYIHKADLAALRDPQINLSSFLAAPYSYQAEVKTLEDKDSIELGTIQLEVIYTPGHTVGGICLLMKKPVNNILFSGDTLFYQSVGRSDFPGADGDLLVKSIKERLLNLPDDTVVYPGHGPSSTIGNEKANNPFIN